MWIAPYTKNSFHTSNQNSFFLFHFQFNSAGETEAPESSEESVAYKTEDDIELPNETGPSQEEIVCATEQITKKIQELLQQAQGGRNSRLVVIFIQLFLHRSPI